MPRAQTPHNPCQYCGQHLMPVKSIEWDTRRYHKKCFKEIKIMEQAEKRQQYQLEDDYKRFDILRRLNYKFF
jgi:hypothetical protein